MVPLRVYEKTIQNGERSLVPVPDHPLQEVLNNPNPITTRYKLKEGTEADTCLNGNFFWLLERERPTDVPTHIWPLQPGRMEYIPDKRTGLPIAWEYDPGSKRDVKTYLPFQIAHGATYNPNDAIWGMPILEAASMASSQDWDAMRYNDAFLNNDCNPGGKIKAEMPLTKEQEIELLNQFTHRHQGPSKQFQPEVYEGGITWEQAQIPHKDMHFIEQRNFNLQDIRMVFGVGKMQLGMTDGVNFASAHVQERIFWTQTLIPEIRFIEATLNEQFKWIENGKIVVLFDLSQVKALQIDIAEKADAARTFWGMGAPFKQVNERLELGFEEFEGWDKSWLTLPGMGVPTDPETGQPVQQLGIHARPIRAITRKERPSSPTVEGGKLTATIEECMPFIEKYEFGIISPLENDFRDKVSRWFIEYRTETLKRFGKETGLEPKSVEPKFLNEGLDNKGILEVLSSILPDPKKWRDKIANMTRKIYERAFTAGVTARSEELGVGSAITEISPSTAHWVETVCLNKVKGIEETTREMLRETIVEGVENGETLAEIAQRIKGVLKDRQKDAMTIARTEVGRAVEKGAYEESFASGLVEGHHWLTGGLNVRESHGTMHGQFAPLGEPFVSGDGAKLLFPHDPNGDAEEVINCFPGDQVVEAEGIQKAFSMPYSGALVTVKTASGNVVTGTPNHPVLTPKGFVALGLLHKGDEVLSCPPGVSLFPGHPKVDHKPTPISEVFDSLASVREVQRISGRPMDFYGDGGHGDVDVVGPFRELLDRLESRGAEVLGHYELHIPDLGEGSGFGDGLPLEFTGGYLSVPAGNVGGTGKGSAFLGGGTGGPDLRGGTTPSDFNTGLNEPAANSAPCQTKIVAQGLFGLSPLVFADEVIELRFREVDSVQVFTLQTDTGLYKTQGILQSNCKCHLLAQPKE